MVIFNVSVGDVTLEIQQCSVTLLCLGLCCQASLWNLII